MKNFILLLSVNVIYVIILVHNKLIISTKVFEIRAHKLLAVLKLIKFVIHPRISIILSFLLFPHKHEKSIFAVQEVLCSRVA